MMISLFISITFHVPPISTLFPYTTLFRSAKLEHHGLWDFFAFGAFADDSEHRNELGPHAVRRALERHGVNFAADDVWIIGDRKSTRLNSSHITISYAVFCLKKK